MEVTPGVHLEGHIDKLQRLVGVHMTCQGLHARLCCRRER